MPILGRILEQPLVSRPGPLNVARGSAAYLATITIMAVVLLILSMPLPATAQTEDISRGGTLKVILQPEPPTLILGLNQQAPTQLVAGKMYEGLLRYDFDLNPMPSLARKWEISEDGMTYTFHLEEGVTWHDGEPFTSKDIVFTTTKFLPETHPRARAIFSNVETVTAPDDQTVVFKLKKPFPAFILTFEVSSVPIMPAHIYENTDYLNNDMNNQPIGTGPFKFESWERGSNIHLVRNENYWQEGKPYLDDIYFLSIPDAASRALALETGQVDVSSFNNIEPFDVPRLSALPHLEVETKGYEFVAPMMWIEINHREAPSDDPRFRQAISYALDREFIRDNIFFGLGRVATGPVNSVTTHYESDVRKYDYDPDKAIALLDEMGLEPDSDGVRASVEFMVMPYGETFTRLAEYSRQALSKVGIDLSLRSTDSAGWAQALSNWDYEMTNDFVYQYGHPALGVSRTYVCDNIRKGVLFSNTMGYCNKEVDKLFAQAAVENDAEKRQALYSKAQQILVDDVPVIWLLEMEFPTIYNTRVHNLTTTAIGTTETFADVWVEQQGQ